MRIVNTGDLGRAIREARKAQGYTQQQLAGYCGCSIMYLSALERGKPTAEIGIALRIVNTLGLDINITERRGA